MGVHTVRSGYHFTMSSLDNSSGSGLSPLESWWKNLWRMKVPTKVKMLIWRACHDWVPTNANLALPSDEIVPWSESFRDDFRRANDPGCIGERLRSLAPVSWQPPDKGCFKTNSDVALDVLLGKKLRRLTLFFKVSSSLKNRDFFIVLWNPMPKMWLCLLLGKPAKLGLSLSDELFWMEETPECDSYSFG
ncbi:hypothetical protein Ddye_028364 [Dipteronia dyeriana]|uniref:Reverse transcriptase zinc-binding domain-containing protein n=1 Tax=Dipteronia dyeriana TaxID=168575 RepID=A0AAD9TQT3_9ROSI|nr:hypothetical protein Ddye_028364 [Dipteronia dyeriana]